MYVRGWRAGQRERCVARRAREEEISLFETAQGITWQFMPQSHGWMAGLQFNRQASLHELEKEFVGGRLHQHHRGAALRVRCGKMIDTQHEQTIICHHGVRLSTSKPAHGRCRSPSAARFGSRSQLAPRRSSAAGVRARRPWLKISCTHSSI